MKLVNVEYLEESSKAIFFNVEFTVTTASGSFWRRKYESTTKTKRAFLEKWRTAPYANYFKWGRQYR